MTEHALLVTKSLDNLVNFVNNEVKKVARWFCSNKMALNVFKGFLYLLPQPHCLFAVPFHGTLFPECGSKSPWSVPLHMREADILLLPDLFMAEAE
jgi:hypothetical protein